MDGHIPVNGGSHPIRPRAEAVAIRGSLKNFAMVLAILRFPSGDARSADLVRLDRWAGEGSVIRGQAMNGDVFALIAEAEWDRAAARDPGRYLVRVAFPDGRVDTRPFPSDSPPGRRRFAVYVAAQPLRDLFPTAVQVAVTVVDAASGSPVGNTLMASIEDFPRPKGDETANDKAPFGWGKPLEGLARILPNAGPDGLRFARVVGTPGLFLSTTEATVSQVGQRLPGYDPKAGRSDEFLLEDPPQPAVNLTPSKALDYLNALGEADPSGLTYRLPTVEEWTLAAKAGKPSSFWWGDEPTFPEGANWLGPEPALAVDATAPSQPRSTSPTFQANPFGLAHTFGNVAEWATDPSVGFARMGGHFRTEPASPLPEVKVEKPEEIGPDAFVGVRPAFDLSGDRATVLIKKRLASDPALAGIGIAYDPDRATVRLTGAVADSSTRRAADRLLEGLWFVAGVENELKTAGLKENQLAILGGAAGPARRVGVLGRTFVEVPVSVRWLDPLPVQGSAWWLNLFWPGGGHQAIKLDPSEPGRVSKLVVRVDRQQLASIGLADTSPFQVGLSLGSPASTPFGPRVVSNPTDVRPVFPAVSR